MPDKLGWLLLTAFFFPVIVVVVGYWLKRKIDKSFEGWKKYDALKEQTFTDWQTKLCKLQNKVERIMDELSICIDRESFEDLSDTHSKIAINVAKLEEQVKHITSESHDHKQQITDLYNIINRRRKERN